MATRKTNQDDGAQTDFVKHGSERHAAILGLRKATDADDLQLEGFTLLDMTAFGPQVTEAYLKEVLRQKVSELNSGAPPEPQSDDPRKPNYHPPIWNPDATPSS